MLRWSLALLALALPVHAGPTLGVNQAWIEGAFGRDLGEGWRPEEWRRVFRRARSAEAPVVRVWLFEGGPFEGVTWDLHRPSGLEPGFLEHVRELARLAREEGVTIYWTLFDGNWPRYVKEQLARERGWNVFNDKYGYGSEFRTRVLGPVLQAIAAEPGASWGLDVINEVQGSLASPGAFEDGWRSARRFISQWIAFVKERVPGLRVTASVGWGHAASDVLAGRMDDLGLDFLDLHVYSDSGLGRRERRVAERCRQRGLPFVLGEVGQSSAAVDDALQVKVLERFLAEAEELGAAAVLVWRLEDRQEDGRRFSLWDGDRERPAVDLLRRFARRWRGAVGALPRLE